MSKDFRGASMSRESKRLKNKIKQLVEFNNALLEHLREKCNFRVSAF